MSTRLLIAGIIASLLLPSTVAAQDFGGFLTPEQVLEQQVNAALGGYGPINTRMASRIAEIQAQRTNAARMAASSSAAALAAQSSSSEALVQEDEEEEFYTSAPDAGTPELSLSEQRLLERYRRQQLINSLGIGSNYGGQQQYHGGAPLAPTGSGMGMVMSAIMLAAVTTLLIVRQYGVKIAFWRK